MKQPNILYIMTDQQRWDTIAALGNSTVKTPNLDRLVRRGFTFSEAYSTCPVCVPARYTIQTGSEPYTTGIFQNCLPEVPVDSKSGPYLARTLQQQGYRTFGIGKFHTFPTDEDLGYETHLHSEEMHASPDERAKDDYARYIADNHPAYAHVEQMHGERTDMYYMPQTSPLPAAFKMEAWVKDRAIEQIMKDDARPFMGFISFIGPHPPFCPPIPYNRMYNPDLMPDPICGRLEVDHMDEQLPWMNHLIWADDISNGTARVLKARYYGMITYIDRCIGDILDAVEKLPDPDNTLICFFSDHGDHLGDHASWQKESYFEPSCHVPFLLSWPKRWPEAAVRAELVCLTDLFAIAARSAGLPELRDGIDIIGMLEGNAPPRDFLFGCYGQPGTAQFKVMVRNEQWKYIWMANGGQEQLFHVISDRCELNEVAAEYAHITRHMKLLAEETLRNQPSCLEALENDKLKIFQKHSRPLERIRQFEAGMNVFDYGM